MKIHSHTRHSHTRHSHILLQITVEIANITKIAAAKYSNIALKYTFEMFRELLNKLYPFASEITPYEYLIEGELPKILDIIYDAKIDMV